VVLTRGSGWHFSKNFRRYDLSWNGLARIVVVALTRRQNDGGAFYFVVWNACKQMVNAVNAGLFLVHRMNHPTRSLCDVGALDLPPDKALRLFRPRGPGKGFMQLQGCLTITGCTKNTCSDLGSTVTLTQCSEGLPKVCTRVRLGSNRVGLYSGLSILKKCVSPCTSST